MPAPLSATARDPCIPLRVSTAPHQTSGRSIPPSRSISPQTTPCLFRLQRAPPLLYPTPSELPPPRLHRRFLPLQPLTSETRRMKIAAAPDHSRSSSCQQSAVRRDSLTDERESNTLPAAEKRIETYLNYQ